MKAIIQRVLSANVSVSNKVLGSIEKGFLIYLGISYDDTIEKVHKLIDKIIKLRIMEDDNQKMNLTLLDVNGDCLVISQFTLYADVSKSNRPSFIQAAKKEIALPLYELFVLELEKKVSVKKGEFGADMKVSSVNDGPVNIIIEV